MKRFLSILAVAGLFACSSSTTNGTGGETSSATTTTDTATATVTTTASATTTTVACTDCLADVLAWGPTGGLVSSTSGSTASPCRTYKHDVTPVSGGAGKSCTVELPACGADALGVADLEAAFAHADVVAAFGQTDPLFGTDPRPCDGSVLMVTRGGKNIYVGGECGTGVNCSSSACVPVPAGVRALANTLAALDTAMLATADCKAIFP
jgi:hypothetical protein